MDRLETQPVRRRLLAALAATAALLACAGFVGVELYVLDGRLGLPLDDAWIHVAFARSVAAGHGLAINPGEPVAGSTSPLWTALVSLGAALPMSDLLWMQLLGVAFHGAGVLWTWGLARRLGLGPGLATVAAGLVATTGWLCWAAVSGMEVPLFVLLTVAGTALHLDERSDSGRPPLSLAVLGLAVLARPEGVLLVALAAGDRLLRFRRDPDGSLGTAGVFDGRPAPAASAGRGLLLALVAIAPVALAQAAIGGSPLPTTLAAKTEGAPGVHLPELQYLHTAAGVLFRAQPWAVLLAPAGCIALARRLGTGRDRGLLPALWLLALPLAYACLSPPDGGPLVGNFGRYLFPLLPFVIVLGVVGLEPLVVALAPGRSPVRRVVALLAGAVLLWPTLTAATAAGGLYGRNLLDVESGDRQAARWLAEHVPDEAVVATMDIGVLAATLPNRVVDLAGIADPEVHRYVRRAEADGGDWQDGVLAFIAARRPDYLVVFPDWLDAVERPGTPFRRLHTIHVPGNVTLGRDTLAVYATPWTRHPPGSANRAAANRRTEDLEDHRERD